MQIGVHIRSAKGIDGLLGVAHNYEPAAARHRKERIKKLPLQRVSILGFIHHGHGKARLHRSAQRCSFRIANKTHCGLQQRIVRERAQHAAVYLVHTALHQIQRCSAVARSRIRLPQPRRGVAQLGFHNPLQPAAVPGLRRQRAGRNQHVIHHFGHQLAAAAAQLRQLRIAAGHAQHALAKPMDGADRGGIKLAYSISKPLAAQRALRSITCTKRSLHAVAGAKPASTPQKFQGSQEAQADAVAQLLRRHARKGCHQYLADRDVVFGHQPRNKGRHRISFAGARAGFHHQAARWQCACQIKFGRSLHHFAGFLWRAAARARSLRILAVRSRSPNNSRKNSSFSPPLG